MIRSTGGRLESANSPSGIYIFFAVIYFEDYLHPNSENQNNSPLDHSSVANKLIKFPNNSADISHSEVGRYVDMLMQMPEASHSDPLLDCKGTKYGCESAQELAKALLDKGVL